MSKLIPNACRAAAGVRPTGRYVNNGGTSTTAVRQLFPSSTSCFTVTLVVIRFHLFQFIPICSNSRLGIQGQDVLAQGVLVIGRSYESRSGENLESHHQLVYLKVIGCFGSFTTKTPSLEASPLEAINSPTCDPCPINILWEICETI